MSKPWYELYSDFSLLLLNYTKPIIENLWDMIRNPASNIDDAVRYWSECPEAYQNQPRNSYFAQYLNFIKNLSPKDRFLSGVNILFLLVTEEPNAKTIRLCFPNDINKFEKTYFPYTTDLHNLQYPIAQYALADMSWETLSSEELQRSLTGNVIASGRSLYVNDVREYRIKDTKEESIRQDVDDDIGFLSLVYIPLVKDKIYILIHSPVINWFSENCKDILYNSFNGELKLYKQSLDLIHSFMQHWEKEAKRTAASVYKDLLAILQHSNAFQEFQEDVLDALAKGLWEQESLGGLLNNMPNPEPFKLKEKIKNILLEVPQLRINLERHLKVDLSFMESDTEFTVVGVKEILKEVLWEIVINAKNYSQTAEMVIDKVLYGWKGDLQKLGAAISLTTKGAFLSIDKYITLRFGIPHRTMNKKDGGFGMWLVNYLVSSGGGIMKVSLNRNYEKKFGAIEEYRKDIDFTVIFPIQN